MIEARNRREILDTYGDPSSAIDLVVADAPGLRPGGNPAADVATAPRPRIPTVLLTDDPAADDVGPDADGRVGLVAKPVEPDTLLRCVEDVLARGQR